MDIDKEPQSIFPSVDDMKNTLIGRGVALILLGFVAGMSVDSALSHYFPRDSKTEYDDLKAKNAILNTDLQKLRDRLNSSTDKETQYTVRIVTSSKEGYGTNDIVNVVVHGELGSSRKHQLDNVDHDDFETGNEDIFTFSGRQVGVLKNIEIMTEHAGSGVFDDLSVVGVFVEKDGKTWAWEGDDAIFGDDASNTTNQLLALESIN